MYSVFYIKPDVDSWNYLLGCYTSQQKMLNAEKILDWMKTQVDVAKPNVKSYRLLIVQYCRLKCPDQVHRLFTEMIESMEPDIECWSRLVEVLARSKSIPEAFQYIDKMKEKFSIPLKLQHILLSCCRRNNTMLEYTSRFGEVQTKQDPYELDEERKAFIEAEFADCEPITGKGWVELENPLSTPSAETIRKREQKRQLELKMKRMEGEFMKKAIEEDNQKPKKEKIVSKRSLMRATKKLETQIKKQAQQKMKEEKKAKFSFRQE
eukprot:TRINITY_DN2677_c0_g1_i4.p1 TRINITY_DN2677_c0_g1~~TRINITY_DN2677_c0_g1_i4.p1  ORF type:complete len:304 (-),score=47.09 TRINITY_DN2677_c0_g1_i4:126-920(-)